MGLVKSKFCGAGLVWISMKVNGSFFGDCTLTTVDRACLAQTIGMCHWRTLTNMFFMSWARRRHFNAWLLLVQWNATITNTDIMNIRLQSPSLAPNILCTKPTTEHGVAVFNSLYQNANLIKTVFFSCLRVTSGNYFPKEKLIFFTKLKIKTWGYALCFSNSERLE